MKKIYLGLGLLALSTGAIAQTSVVTRDAITFQRLDFSKQDNIIKKDVIANSNKALGVTVWSDDFSDPMTWTVDNNGQTGAEFGWNINTTNEGWFTGSGLGGVINSTSDGNFAEVQNGDYNAGDQATGVVYNLTTANPIDVNTLTSGVNNVVLQFEQFGALFNDSQTILVSTDGTTWTEVGSNNNRTTFVGNNPSAVYANSETVTYNISSAIQANPSTVWIRFSWTSRFATQMDPVAWTTFGWFIDDVAIVTSPDHDLTLNGVRMFSGPQELPYYIVPTGQVTDINFFGSVTNNGTQSQTNTVLSVTAGGNTYTSATGFDQAPLMTDTLFTTTAFNPGTAVATYPINFSVGSDFTDDVPGDNTGAETMYVTNHIYARDKAGLTGAATTGSVSNWAGTGPGDNFRIGNIFDIVADQTVYAVTVKLSGTVPTGGALTYCQIYKFDAGSQTYVLLEETEEKNITTAAQITNMQTYILNNPVDLFAGDDLLVVAGHYGEEISFAYSGSAPDGSVVGFDASGSLVGLANPVNICVRLNFDESISVQEENNGVAVGQNFPNPYNGNTQVNYTLTSTEEVMVEITDLTGKVIAVMNEGVRTAGSHTLTFNSDNMAAGTYFYTLSTSKGKVTKSMVVAK